MKKKIALAISIIAVILSYCLYWAFFDMDRLPEGNLVIEVQSPNGEYTIKAYVSEYSLSAPAVRGELNYNRVEKKPKNIYWNYREDSADVEWIDNTTVNINGHKLNILRDTFDWRREK